MKTFHFTLLICSVVLAACSKDLNLTEDILSVTTSNYSIPLEDALKSLQAYLDSENDLMTKSESQEGVKSRIISDVHTIRLTAVNTKGTDLPVDCDSLLYLVNFQNDEGFAILAADKRISDDVIAVTESGNMSEEYLYSAISDYSRKIYPEYPTTGPGIITSDDFPGEYFLNPNTFELYDPSVDDYYVGNYIDDVSTSSYGEAYAQPKLIGDLVVAYSLVEITSDDFNDNSNYSANNPYVDETTDDSTNVITEITDTTTTYITMVDPILDFAKKWTQESPFNDYCPTVYKWLVFKPKRADAGCVPLALAKIFTHHEKPTITYNDIKVKWEDLKADYTSARSSAAAATRHIGKKCFSLYFYNGTFTFPSLAKSFMGKNDYNNVALQDYNTSTVTSMLDKNNPLFICSIPQSGITDSHGWNIDGYKIKFVTLTTEYYVNSVLKETKRTGTSTVMVHCDFGWGGAYNGYFVSGIFDLGSSSTEFDESKYAGKNSTYYNSYLKIISYE